MKQKDKFKLQKQRQLSLSAVQVSRSFILGLGCSRSSGGVRGGWVCYRQGSLSGSVVYVLPGKSPFLFFATLLTVHTDLYHEF